MRWRPVVVSLGLMSLVTGCASTQPAPAMSRTLLGEFASTCMERFEHDAEMNAVFVQLTNVRSGRYGLEGDLTVNRAHWSALDLVEQDRLVRKAAGVMLESLRPLQQSGHGALASINMVDELGEAMGAIAIGGADPNGYTYTFRP